MDTDHSGDREIVRAAEVLRRGGLVAFPTETVYGLGADATNSAAVRRLFEVKGRPIDHPVIVHVLDADDLSRWAEPNDTALALADAFWPGPLTVIVERRVDEAVGDASVDGPVIVDTVSGGRATIGVRAPQHPLAQALLAHARVPIAAPSANRFGRVSPTSAMDVRVDLASDLGDDLVVIDGGPCDVGVESTIVDCTGTEELAVVRRLGGVSRTAIESVLGRRVSVAAQAGTASGTLASHYAPRARVELCSPDLVTTRAAALSAMGLRVGLVATRDDVGDARGDVDADLTVPGGLAAFAHDLYRRLRRGDELGLDVILAVVPESGEGSDAARLDARGGLGEVIADRLRRAAGEGATS